MSKQFTTKAKSEAGGGKYLEEVEHQREKPQRMKKGVCAAG